MDAQGLKAFRQGLPNKCNELAFGAAVSKLLRLAIKPNRFNPKKLTAGNTSGPRRFVRSLTSDYNAAFPKTELRQTGKAMSESDLNKDRQLLIDTGEKGKLSLLGAYTKLSGPGWLQSALTLGGGSLGSSLYLGILGGMTLLWLQPFAMILGEIMMSAISYVTLSTGALGKCRTARRQNINQSIAHAQSI